MKKININNDLKITYGLIILILITGLINVTILLKEDDHDNNELVIEKKGSITEKNYQNFFAGNLIKEVKINNRYLSVLYENNTQYESHLIDLKNNKEIDVNGLIKAKNKKNYSKKIEELLLLKYPTRIKDILLTSKSSLFFDNSDLTIYYYPEDLETSRSFSLKVDYNEIKDYLVFKPLLNKNYQNENGFTYDPNKITIALTFDDGPNGERTKALVDALEDYKMSATFFMLGSKFTDNADIVKKVYNSHSEVGYHSYAHKRFTLQTSEEIKNEFKLSDDAFYKITGDHIKLTRPPYGNYNSTVLQAIDNAFIRWNIDTNDWQYKDVNYLVNYVVDNLQDRSIILFHDSYESSKEAAINLLDILYLKDVQILSVSNMANLLNFKLENHEVYFSFK